LLWNYVKLSKAILLKNKVKLVPIFGTSQRATYEELPIRFAAQSTVRLL